jgi:pyruvate kinase
MTRRAKIIATLGPASQSFDCLLSLVESGVDVVRLNFSHGDRDSHLEAIRLVKRVREELDRPIAILQDLRGPKLRTGSIEGDREIELVAGERCLLTTKKTVGKEGCIPVNYEPLPEEVHPGDRILLDDGRLELKVLRTDDTDVITEVAVGGELGSNKGINLPGVHLRAPALTEKDFDDLAFGLEHEVDIIAISFVRSAEDVKQLKQAAHDSDSDKIDPLIIAKLERPEALENLDAILEVSDGVMVARGDLGVEVSPEKVPSLQKWIIQEANLRSCLVITATQMLETMIDNPRATRAEASDVANAVFDGSDALMLSGETAIGKYPVRSVKTMDRIIRDAESHTSEWGHNPPMESISTLDDAAATTHAARTLAMDRNVAAVAVFTRSGRTAHLMSKVRPHVPILAFTPEGKTYQRLSILWGVLPQLIPMAESVEEMIEHVRKACKESELVRPGQQVVMIASHPVGAMGPPNFTLLLTIE